MEKKDIKDYLHFYFKQWVNVVDKRPFTKTLPTHDNEEPTIYDGDWALSHHILGMAMLDEVEVKPYLRPLTSITVEESKEINIQMGQILLAQFPKEAGLKFFTAPQFSMLLSKRFDLFNLIPEGLAIDSTLKPV